MVSDMQTKTTLVKGLTFDILIEEIQHQDKNGGQICYLASIYVVFKGATTKRLVRRSRIVGAAEELTKEIRRDGIRIFDRFKHL